MFDILLRNFVLASCPKMTAIMALTLLNNFVWIIRTQILLTTLNSFQSFISAKIFKGFFSFKRHTWTCYFSNYFFFCSNLRDNLQSMKKKTVKVESNKSDNKWNRKENLNNNTRNEKKYKRATKIFIKWDNKF